MCASRFQRTSREVGGDAGGEAAQNRAQRFSTKQACRKTAALGFPPPAGVAPYPMREGQHRARPTGEPARVSPRAGFAYSLAKGTLQGRCGNTSRRARESFSRPEKARVGRCQLSCVDGASGAVGCCGAAVSRHFAKCLDRQTQAPRHFGGLGGTWRCVATRVNRAGPSEARMGGRGGAATGVNTPIKRRRESGCRGTSRRGG